MPGSAALDLSDVPVVDGHCHPLLVDPWALAPAVFTELFTEGRPGTMAAHVVQTGYFRRALREAGPAPRHRGSPWRPCSRGAGSSDRRGVARWTAQSRIVGLLVDTGYPPHGTRPRRGFMSTTLRSGMR